MKIALYVHCFFPTHYHGTETYTLALAQNLQAMGHEPVVVSSIPQGETKSIDLVTHYDYQGIPVYCIDKNFVPCASIRETCYQPQMREIHRKLLKEIQPHIVHVTHPGNHTAALLEVVQELSIPLVATFTDFFGFCFNSKLEAANGGLCPGPNPQRTNCFACYAKAVIQHVNPGFSEQAINRIAPLISWCSILFNWVHRLPVIRSSRLSAKLRDIKARPELLAGYYRNYQKAIAPTLFLQSAYVKNGLSESPIQKISFGVNLDRKPKEIRPPLAPMRFGFIGQIAPHKGTALLVDAFCRLPQGKCELYIYGAEDQYPGYTKAMKKRCSNFPVFFRGTFPSDEMRKVLDEMDFLVIPSTWYENSPLVLLNALASHTPVIVSNVEGLTEFLEPGKNGYAFARGNTDDLENVMRNILANPENSRSLCLSTEYPKTALMMTEEVMEIYKVAISKPV